MTSITRVVWTVIALTALWALPATAQAPKQEERPKGPLSPSQKVTATIAGASIAMTYDAPSMRGREIFGRLVPYGSVWCPGANWATTISSPEAGIQIGTLNLPKGVYALWVLPNRDEWELIVNSDDKAFHLNYNKEKDLGRMKLNLKHLEEPVEQLRFEVRPGSGNQGTLALLWEKTEASISLTVLP